MALEPARPDRGRVALAVRRAALALAFIALLAPAAIAPAAPDDCPDALITADVKSRLMARHPVAALKINVETDQCIVTLKGCAGTRTDIKDAVKAARKVKKVRGVKSELTICPRSGG